MDLTATVMAYAAGALIVVFVVPRLIANRVLEDAPRPRSSPRQFVFWASTLVLLLGLVLDASGGVVLLFLVFWCGVWVWRLAPRWLALLPAACLLVLVTAFIQGYKLYGSSSVVDNRPLLHEPLVLKGIEHPNVVVAADGSRHQVRGITFREELLQLPPETLAHLFWQAEGRPLRFLPDASYPSGYAAEARVGHFCGNTFFPRLLPPRLPRYQVRDLGLILRPLGKQAD